MKAPQVLPLDENSLAYVHSLLTNHLTNADFNYGLTVNKSAIPLFSKTQEILPFERVREMYANDNSVFCIDVTFRNGMKTKGGSRIILTSTDDEDNDYSPLELGGYPKYSTSGQKQRENEIIERERLRITNESLTKENGLLTQTNESLKDQLKKAEEFSDEVEKLVVDLKTKSQDKGTLEQIGDFIGKVATYAPGLLKNTPLEGFAKTSEASPVQNLGATTATPKTQAQPVQPPAPQFDEETIALAKAMRELKPYFSQFEFQDCFKLLGLIARYKPLIGELYDLALSEVKRQVDIRQQAAAKKQPTPAQQPQVVKHEQPEQTEEPEAEQEQRDEADADYTDDPAPPTN